MKKVDVFQKYGIDKDNIIIKTSLTQQNFLIENKDSEIRENYQRLEFLGDRVISLIVAEYLYTSFKKKEDIMTKELLALTTNKEHYYFSKYLRFR